tara:strand:- start:1238 stop:1606 length:369 start_codon:yes stop_codon:yes gene_type:complete
MIGVIDIEAMPHCPTSKFLTKEEIVKFDPGWNQNRMNFIFKHEVPVSVDDNIAMTLTSKYPSLELIGVDGKKVLESDKYDFDDYTYLDLKKLAMENDIPSKETFVKREALIEKIKFKLNDIQ